MAGGSDRTSVSVAVCTFRRNDDLVILLQALLRCAERVRSRAAVGVTIVDDTVEGLAQPVVDGFQGQFELGLEYRISGKQNISIARNLAIETAMRTAEWTAMTDDDCEPPAEWLEALLDCQRATDANCVTGRMVRRAPPGSPGWLTAQPFFDLGVECPENRSQVEAGATFNSMIRSQWLIERPGIRFDPAFGVIGGEDMVFYRAARDAGLEIRFAADAFVYENEPPGRATFRYQLFVHYWHGNSAYLSGVRSGIPRWRMAAHGLASLARAATRPVGRLAQGKAPQFRFGLAKVMHATGQLAGSLGVRVNHR